MSQILDLLKQGDKRTTGNVFKVVDLVLNNIDLSSELIEALKSNFEALKMRASDALQKVFIQKPEIFERHKDFILNDMPQIDQQEVRWHWAQIISEVDLNSKQKVKVITILMDFILNSKSSILRTFSLDALHKFAIQEKQIKKQFITLVNENLASFTPAMKARLKKLLF